MADAELIPIDKLNVSSGTQMRASMDEAAIAEYAAALEHDDLPPCSVVTDGQTWWLVDGYHRMAAHIRVGRKQLLCRVAKGSLRAAILAAAGANATHGLRRSAADKRKAVAVLLGDAEWSQWSDREIARRCGVANSFVSSQRAALTVPENSESAARKYTTKHGTEATMDTSAIGSKRAPPSEPQSAATPATTQAQGDEDDGAPTLAELAAELEDALAREKALLERLAILEADDQRKQLVQVMQRLEHSERQQAGAMERAASWQRRAEFYERLLAKIGKVVDERDIDKILSAVTRAARPEAA